MPTEQVQRQINQLLDEAEAAVRINDWVTARLRAQAALDLDPTNEDAQALIAGATRTEARAATGKAAPLTDVPSSLEAISPATGESESESIDSQEAHDSLYRRTFVGRETELKQLQGWFDAAISGRGGLTMVVGEPGIGKTALCEQLSAYAVLRGGRSLVGHSYEEGSLSLPYLAFVEALRSYVLTREIAGLKSDLGSSAPEVARIVPEIRDRVEVDQARPGADPEEDRWRLLQAVTSFLRNAATVQPLLLILEDLHWADRGTLDLLLHIARNLRSPDAAGHGARLLVVGTYRDVEVDRAHPLSATLAELHRIGSFARLPLRGLTIDEVHRMYGALRGQEVSWAQAEIVHRQTEGNPLFVQEVLRYLVEEGYVVRESGRYVLAAGTEPGTGIPEGLRDVVGKRLNRLSQKTNQVLAIAAVLGREFRLDVLQQVAGIPEEELYAALEEAIERAVVEERSDVAAAVTYRFAHAFFRQTLYEETIAPRRIRLHQQVARALESVYGRRLEDHASELAEHYSHSSNADDLKKAVEYGELAAKRAASVFDYGEAQRHLEQAIKVQEVLDPDDNAKLSDLLLALGDAMLPLENPARVISASATPAYALAEALGDTEHMLRACLQALESLHRSRSMSPAEAAEGATWAAKAEPLVRPGSSEQIRLLSDQGQLALAFKGPEAAYYYLRPALEAALQSSNDAAFFTAAEAVVALRALSDRRRQVDVARQVLSRQRTNARLRDVAIALGAAGRTLIERGDRDAAEAAWHELVQIADRIGDVSLRVGAEGPRLFLMFMDGRLEEALALAESQLESAREAGVVGLGRTHVITARMLHYLGRPQGSLLEDLPIQSRSPLAMRATLFAFTGNVEEVRGIREHFKGIDSPSDGTSSAILLRLFEAAILTRDLETVATLLPRLEVFSDELGDLSTGIGVEVSIGRLAGEAASLLGAWDKARECYRQAEQVCERARFRTDLALTRLDLAELLLAHYPHDRSAAIGHLDFAIAEFREMKMQPSLERAQLLHDGLAGAGPQRHADPQADRARYPHGLSEREVEVLRLIASGRTNPEIAEALVISRSTVQNHVSSILAKAGLANRAEAAAYAQRHNLI